MKALIVFSFQYLLSNTIVTIPFLKVLSRYVFLGSSTRSSQITMDRPVTRGAQAGLFVVLVPLIGLSPWRGIVLRPSSLTSWLLNTA